MKLAPCLALGLCSPYEKIQYRDSSRHLGIRCRLCRLSHRKQRCVHHRHDRGSDDPIAAFVAHKTLDLVIMTASKKKIAARRTEAAGRQVPVRRHHLCLLRRAAPLDGVPLRHLQAADRIVFSAHLWFEPDQLTFTAPCHPTASPRTAAGRSARISAAIAGRHCGSRQRSRPACRRCAPARWTSRTDG